MKHAPPRGIVLAFAAAVLMHLLLFVSAMPSYDPAGPGERSPPQTSYLMPAAEGSSDSKTVRQLNSPVLSSLPSALGFSGQLREHDVQNPKTFTPLSVPSEYFLELSPSAPNADERLNVEHLLISAAVRGPGLPVEAAAQSEPYPAGKRVQLAPELRARLVGGIVLPPALNQETDAPWIAHAELAISEQGLVEHVFLEQPLEPASLNRQVLEVLYNLRFKAGAAQSSSIEIYSPAPGRGGGTSQ